MQASQTPTLVPLAFAANGTKNTIPEASQIGITPGAASLNDGFPPLTFTPVAAGGVPPAGADFNGVLNLITASIRWAHGGGRYAFSSTFAADANVSGYPAGAMLMSADTLGAWLSLNDSNTDNPDTGPGTKWVPAHAYGVTAVTGLTNVNVTLTPAQAAKNKITLAGTLTSNVQIIFPTWTRDWTVVNNTTGAFTVTAKTSAGSGVAIPQDASPTKVTGDGTNITQPAENVAPATQSQNAVQFGQVAGVVGSVRNLRAYLATAGTSLTFTADEVVVESALGGLRYCVPNLNASVSTSVTGALGGVVGAALTASGFAGIYVGVTAAGTAGLFINTAGTTTLLPNVSASPPPGVIASALVSVWPLNGSTQFAQGLQTDRLLLRIGTQVLSTTSGTGATWTSLSISGAVPANAKIISGTASAGTNSTASATTSTFVASDINGIGAQQVFLGITSASGSSAGDNFSNLALAAAQTMFYQAINTAGSPTFSINVNSYTI